jgi:hypothetical protein
MDRQAVARMRTWMQRVPRGFAYGIIALGLVASTASGRAVAADPAQAVHGSADRFTAPGVALAWGILRGTSEATTTVVVRVVADRQAFGALEVVGIDPFTQKSERRLAPTALSGRSLDYLDVRMPRAQFADFPRTELRFFASASPSASDVPKLVVYYLGIPDTTPEFPSDAALEQYLAARTSGALEGQGGRKP